MWSDSLHSFIPVRPDGCFVEFQAAAQPNLKQLKQYQTQNQIETIEERHEEGHNHPTSTKHQP